MACLCVVTPAGASGAGHAHGVLMRGHSLASVTARALAAFPGGATVEPAPLAKLPALAAEGVQVPPLLLRKAQKWTDAKARKEAATVAAAAHRREAARLRVEARKAKARAVTEARRLAERVARAAATRAARKVVKEEAEGRLVLPEGRLGDTAAPWD